MDQGVARRGVGGLEAYSQRTQTPFVGSPERLAVLEQGAVQVQADVRLQTLWKTFQHLETEREGKIEASIEEETRRQFLFGATFFLLIYFKIGVCLSYAPSYHSKFLFLSELTWRIKPILILK